jgi:hypothetical protein
MPDRVHRYGAESYTTGKFPVAVYTVVCRVYIFAEHGKELLCRVLTKVHTAKENHSVKFDKTHGKEKTLGKDLKKHTANNIYSANKGPRYNLGRTKRCSNGAMALLCVFPRHSANKRLCRVFFQVLGKASSF